MKYIKYLFISLLPIGLLLNYLSSLNSSITKEIYSNYIYRQIFKTVSGITNKLPISIAEILLIFFAVVIIWQVLIVFKRLIKNPSKVILIIKKTIINIFALTGVLYFLFVLMWGMNYNNSHIAEILELDISPPSVEELINLCSYLADEANLLRPKVQEDAQGVMHPDGGYKGVFERAYSGFEELAKNFPQLAGHYGKPKSIMMSPLLSYTGIWGIYIPFTSEANININIPAPFLPSTTSHEMAHQLGFAREEEANYVAYLTCRLHPDFDFQYSGILFALNHALNELYLHDSDKYDEIRLKLDKGIERDFEEINRFNNKYNGRVREAFSQSNDLYLKANGQKQGEKSYNKVVELLIGEYRLNLTKN